MMLWSWFFVDGYRVGGATEERRLGTELWLSKSSHHPLTPHSLTPYSLLIWGLGRFKGK